LLEDIGIYFSELNDSSDLSNRLGPSHLKLVVTHLSAPKLASLWMVVLLQGTSTPLVHAHAGRTHFVGADR
jgi:hypothetical protein